MKKKLPFTPNPRIWNAYQVATRLGRSEGWFRGNQTGLEKKGFPIKLKELGGWDGNAVDRWIDIQSGFVDTAVISEANDNSWSEALENATDL